jgi:beta propeller repeat protein
MISSIHKLPRRFAVSVGVFLLCFLSGPLHAQQQFQGLCSRVKMQIQQELTTERVGFEATLEVTNNDGADPITQFSAELTFRDPETGNNAADRFVVQPPTFENINRIDGTGVIGATKKAVVKWFIIPKISAGGTNPQGKQYAVGARLAGKMRGENLPADSLLVVEDNITVKPESQLEIIYFQPRDVTGDDPFTLEVESPVPFTLGVLVRNAGYGVARKVKINSQQPKIVSNSNGLLLVARLLGARVQDSSLRESSLLVDLGDINPGQARKGAWDMITSLSGEFIEFKASYTHADELGGLETSIIKSIAAHFISHEVLNDEAGRDQILDFLADTDRDAEMIPDTLFETDGATLPVNHLLNASAGALASGKAIVTVAADREGWGYVRLDDPAQARFGIQRVVRSDGKVLNSHNVWTNIRYRRADNFKLTYLNILDRVQNGVTYTYEITYQAPLTDTTPPLTRLRFSGDVSEAAGVFYTTPATQLYFTSEDQSPVSIHYRLNGAAYRPGLPFHLDQPGTYTVDYFATDLSGNTETVKSATVVVPGGDQAVSLTLGQVNIFPTDLLSTRPGKVPITALAPASPVRLDGELKIYRGVIAWPTISGVPVSPTPRATASLTVGGAFVERYRYRLNGGAWSAERAATQPIDLTGLTGNATVSVVARHSLGGYPEDAEALAVSWVVNPTAPDLQVTGTPATPTNIASNVTLQPADASASLYRWTIDNGYYRAEQSLATPLVLERLSEGFHEVKVVGQRGAVWQEESSASAVNWTFDRGYGFDYSRLPLVRTRTFSNVGGQQISFDWDGRDDNGVQQIPGPYTILLIFTDVLGNKNRASALVVIDGLSVEQFTLADATSGARRVRAAGDWAVWQHNEGGIWNIRGRNLASLGAVVPLTADAALNQESPATDGRYVVWQGLQPNGSSDIRFINLSTLAAGNVTSTPGLSEVNPAVDWPWVVYQVKPLDNPASPWQVQAYNAVTGQTTRVSPGVGDQFRPQIHGGRVVWEDHRDVGSGEIYFADLEEGTVRRLTNNSFGQNNPVIYADMVAWQDNRNSQVDIYGFDLLKGTESRLTNTPYNETNPFVAGSWLLYEEDSLGAGTENLRLMDLQTGQGVSLTKAEKTYSSGALGNGFAVWIDQLDSTQRQAVASLLPGLQPLAHRSNALAVTQRLVDRFDSAFDLLADWGVAAGIASITVYDSFAPLSSRTARLVGGVPQGDDFALAPGGFVWADFGQAHLADLGPGDTNRLNLATGLNAFSYTGFPLGYTAYDLIDSIGIGNLKAVRFFDSFAGKWRAVEVAAGGVRIGPNFAIPRVATLLLDLKNPLNAWKP